MPSCVSCSSRSSPLVVAPCSHAFCHACLRRMARLAVKDRCLVPLRCCKKELSTETVALAFSLSSTDANRRERNVAKYKAFLAERTAQWKSSDIASDREYAETVARVGGKQCPGCGVGVQRDFGCVHMTCPNGHEFCFTCLKRWRTCTCEYIPEHEIRAILGE